MDTILVRRSMDVVRLPTCTLTLCYEQRRKSRQRVVLDDGTEAAVLMEHGATLNPGDVLTDETDRVRVGVRAAEEPVSCVTSSDARLLARACYHLGNRHVAVEIGTHSVSYPRDHVLDDMVRRLGLEVQHLARAFHPETGAYAHDHR